MRLPVHRVMLSSCSFYNTFVPGRYRDGTGTVPGRYQDGVPVRLPVHRVILSSCRFYNSFVPGRYRDGTGTAPGRYRDGIPGRCPGEAPGRQGKALNFQFLQHFRTGTVPGRYRDDTGTVPGRYTGMASGVELGLPVLGGQSEDMFLVCVVSFVWRQVSCTGTWAMNGGRYES